MSLYLCVLDTTSDTEFEGVEVGPYSYFAEVRELIRRSAEKVGIDLNKSVLLNHSDCSGVWATSDLDDLENEIRGLMAHFKVLQGRMISNLNWYVAWYLKSRPQTLHDSVVDVDGNPLLSRICELIRVARERCLPISFQ